MSKETGQEIVKFCKVHPGWQLRSVNQSNGQDVPELFECLACLWLQNQRAAHASDELRSQNTALEKRLENERLSHLHTTKLWEQCRNRILELNGETAALWERNAELDREIMQADQRANECLIQTQNANRERDSALSELAELKEKLKCT